MGSMGMKSMRGGDMQNIGAKYDLRTIMTNLR